MSVEQIERVLENPDREKAGPTAPAQGLCLMEVDYDQKKISKAGKFELNFPAFLIQFRFADKCLLYAVITVPTLPLMASFTFAMEVINTLP